MASALALSVNWLTYIWAVAQGRVVDGSLGYFINPLFSVVLAVVVLKERLRAGQWAAIALALGGVVWLTALIGQLPWIGLTLAASFGIYGLLRKAASIDALGGTRSKRCCSSRWRLSTCCTSPDTTRRLGAPPIARCATC